MAEIRALIFDLDGVIADTAEMHYQSWKRLADEEGIPFERADNEALRGKTRDVSLQIFTQELNIDEETRQEWFKRKNRYFLEMMAELQPEDTLPGVRRLIDEARAAGMRVGVGSASRNAVPVLQKLGLLERFDVVGDGYTVCNSKPAPDIFVWVAGALRVSPNEALVLEDSQAGVRAALKGGFYVVGLGSAPVQEAHAVLPGLGDTALSELIQRVLS